MNLAPRAAAMVQATHPIPAASVTALTGALAVARGAGPGTLAWIVLSTALGQASVGWSNDYLDRFEDVRAARDDKPIVAGRIAPSTVRAAALASLYLSMVLSLPLGPAEAVTMGAAVSSAWVYNLWLKRSAFSWLPYAVSFGLLPLYVWLATGGLPPAWVPLAAASLGVAGHLTNVLPDLEGDVAAGHRGLPHRLGPGRSLAAASVVLVGALALVVGAGRAWRAPAAVVAAVVALLLVAAVAVVVRRGRERAGFHLTIAAAAAIAAVLVLSSEGPTA